MSDVDNGIGDIPQMLNAINPRSDEFDADALIPDELPGSEQAKSFMEGEGMEQFTTATNPLLLSGFNNFRTQNTIMYGGIGDDVGRFRKTIAGGRGKFATFSKGSLNPNVARGANQFVGGVNIFGRTTRRGRRLATPTLAAGGKPPLVKGFLKNNRINPRRFLRKNSLTDVLAGHNRNFYSPYGGGFLSGIGNYKVKPGYEPRFSGGMVARMGALTKIEKMAAAGKSTARMDFNLARLAMANSPSHLRAGAVNYGGRSADDLVRAFFAGESIPNSFTHTAHGAIINKAATGGTLTVGERRYLMSQGIRGKYSKKFFDKIALSGGGSTMFEGFDTTALKTFGAGTLQMTDNAEKLMRPLVAGIEKNASFRMLAANKLGVAVPMTEYGSAQLGKKIIEGGFVKTLGHTGALKAVQAGGTKVGLAVAGEYALKAIPGVNMIFAADLAYQLAKLGGLAVKGAINFGKDAMKSMQGNINGGMFGTYKDDEVRATSRARGVMAIQNSRLNARSLLGSEGAMMAAHFG